VEWPTPSRCWSSAALSQGQCHKVYVPVHARDFMSEFVVWAYWRLSAIYAVTDRRGDDDIPLLSLPQVTEGITYSTQETLENMATNEDTRIGTFWMMKP
jgi:hypothetical protein